MSVLSLKRGFLLSSEPEPEPEPQPEPTDPIYTIFRSVIDKEGILPRSKITESLSSENDQVTTQLVFALQPTLPNGCTPKNITTEIATKIATEMVFNQRNGLITLAIERSTKRKFLTDVAWRTEINNRAMSNIVMVFRNVLQLPENTRQKALFDQTHKEIKIHNGKLPSRNIAGILVPPHLYKAVVDTFGKMRNPPKIFKVKTTTKTYQLGYEQLKTDSSPFLSTNKSLALRKEMYQKISDRSLTDTSDLVILDALEQLYLEKNPDKAPSFSSSIDRTNMLQSLIRCQQLEQLLGISDDEIETEHTGPVPEYVKPIAQWIRQTGEQLVFHSMRLPTATE